MSPQLILRIIGMAALVVAVLFAVLAIHYYLSNNIRAVMDDLSGKTRAAGVAEGRRASRAASGKGGREAGDARRRSRKGAARKGAVSGAGGMPGASTLGEVAGSRAGSGAAGATATAGVAAARDVFDGKTTSATGSASQVGEASAVSKGDDGPSSSDSMRADSLGQSATAGTAPSVARPSEPGAASTGVSGVASAARVTGAGATPAAGGGPSFAGQFVDEEDDLKTVVVPTSYVALGGAAATSVQVSAPGQGQGDEQNAAFRITRRIVHVHSDEIIAYREEL